MRHGTGMSVGEEVYQLPPKMTTPGAGVEPPAGSVVYSDPNSVLYATMDLPQTRGKMPSNQDDAGVVYADVAHPGGACFALMLPALCCPGARCSTGPARGGARNPASLGAPS